MEKQVNIKVETMNAVLNYLGTRPFVEVSRLIQALVTESNTQSEAKEGE
jgi:hypothetical protein